MFLLVVIFILVDFHVVTLHNPKAFWFPFVDVSSLCLVPGCLCVTSDYTFGKDTMAISSIPLTVLDTSIISPFILQYDSVGSF